MGEDTRNADGDGPGGYTREGLQKFLAEIGPMGLDYIGHFTNVAGCSYDGLIAACRHFGLVHHLMYIGPKEIENEVRAREARGAKPRQLTEAISHMLHYDSREDVEARLDIYARRVAEAEAQIAAGTYRWDGDVTPQEWLVHDAATYAANPEVRAQARRKERVAATPGAQPAP